MARTAQAAPVTQRRPLVFINYRGSDGRSVARLIFTSLVNHLGRDAVFLDCECIPLGQDYERILLDGVRHSAVLLALIGQRWLAPDGAGRLSLDDPADWVRREIFEAVRHGVPVVPVLFGGVTRLDVAQLPAALRFLGNRRPHVVHDRSRIADVAALVEKLAWEIPRIRRDPGVQRRQRRPRIAD